MLIINCALPKVNVYNISKGGLGHDNGVSDYTITKSDRKYNLIGPTILKRVSKTVLSIKCTILRRTEGQG